MLCKGRRQPSAPLGDATHTQTSFMTVRAQHANPKRTTLWAKLRRLSRTHKLVFFALLLPLWSASSVRAYLGFRQVLWPQAENAKLLQIEEARLHAFRLYGFDMYRKQGNATVVGGRGRVATISFVDSGRQYHCKAELLDKFVSYPLKAWANPNNHSECLVSRGHVLRNTLLMTVLASLAFLAMAARLAADSKHVLASYRWRRFRKPKLKTPGFSRRVQ